MDTEDDAKEDEHLETGVACQTVLCIFKSVLLLVLKINIFTD